MSVDPITLRVVSGALRAACEEMGAVLIRAAHSANIKERRDASCALFDPDGAHGDAGRAHPRAPRRDARGGRGGRSARTHAPGVAWVLNDPYRGGTHLPDITVITPAFADDGTLLGFAANRAHHADVGGPTPGSMPADSTTLADEGVVIPPRRLDAAAIDELVAQMRQPAQRRADLRAQLAANRAGVERLRELHARGGLRRRDGRDDRLRRAPHARVPRRAPRRHAHRDRRAGGARGRPAARLAATVEGDELTLDFTGSRPSTAATSTARSSVTRSACWFAVRVLTDPDIPPTAGAYRPITVIAPEGSLLNARPPAAVVAGNVETSSRVADLVLAAFGRALGQGTMNNLTLGSDAFTYYETLGGGQGACADADGPSGVHVAMSNTLNTPVEALELEFPMRVTRVRDPARVGRRGRAPRRRRRDPRARGARRDALLAAHRAPPARAAGRGGRRAGRAGAQPPRRRGAPAEGER